MTFTLPGLDNLRLAKYFRLGVNHRRRKKRGGMRLPAVRSAVLISTTISALALAGTAGGAPSAVQTTSKPTLSAHGSPQVALQRALALFAPERATASYRAAATKVDPRSATLVLRDLAARLTKLSDSDRRLARAILARPTDGASEGPAGWDGIPRRYRERVCTARFCVHWVRRGDEKPSLTDRRPRNGRPDYVDKTIANVRAVWEKEIGALDYKKPLPDGSSGSHHGGNPNRRIDIYIAQIGNVGLYGYCTTDEPRPSASNNRQVSAYCVIDNDFRRAEFQSGAYGNNANKVTIAHEFFHAVQFAYDYFDNRAMMEGTATWMEDQVFTGVNDNRQYFTRSPLGPDPWAPLDLFASSGPFAGWQYGTWIWYRFLSENLGAGSADLPLIVRRIWQEAVEPGQNGFFAIAPALASRSTTVLAQMMRFGVWNSSPFAAGHYREAKPGSGYRAAGVTRLPGDPALAPTDSFTAPFEMLRRSNDYLRVYPASSAGAGTTLDFSNVSVPTAAGDIEAIVFRRNGTIDAPVDVNNSSSVAFDYATVSRVIFVYTNASGTDFLDPNFFSFDALVTP
jgi:hypothetical protein